MNVPPPTWCPECRFQRRFAFMNLRAFYRSKCDKCNENIVSMYKPDSPFTVYCSKCWWGDSWDGTEYARKYDPSRPFLAQVLELRNSTPFVALVNNYPTLVNTEYANYCSTQKNCYMTVFGDLGENVLYSDFFAELKDSTDSYRIGKSQLFYEVIGGYSSYNVKWSEEVDQCRDVYFSRDLTGCSDCFGCTGLRNKKYCMWNEELGKEEYREFPPAEFSPYAYNESLALEYFPLSESEAEAKGYRWEDVAERQYKMTMPSGSVPDDISSVEDSIVKEVIQCEHKGECSHPCLEVFRIVPQELQFYRRFNIPLPRTCFNCRHYERLNLRNSNKLYPRTCMCEKAEHDHAGKCKNEFETSYAPERPEIVYCEQCYQKEVV